MVYIVNVNRVHIKDGWHLKLTVVNDIRPLGIFKQVTTPNPKTKEEKLNKIAKYSSSKENSPVTINGVLPAYKISTDGICKNSECTWKIHVKKIGYKRSGKLRNSSENTA